MGCWTLAMTRVQDSICHSEPAAGRLSQKMVQEGLMMLASWLSSRERICEGPFCSSDNSQKNLSAVGSLKLVERNEYENYLRDAYLAEATVCISLRER